MMLRLLIPACLLVCLNTASADRMQLAQVDSFSGWNLTPDQAAQGISGRVLGVQTIIEKGRTLYVYKVLTLDGRIHYVKVDSVTGQHL